MGSCTAQCKMLLFCANTVMRESAKFELARLKKEEEENRFWRFGNFFGAVLCVEIRNQYFTILFSRGHLPRSPYTAALQADVGSPRANLQNRL